MVCRIPLLYQLNFAFAVHAWLKTISALTYHYNWLSTSFQLFTNLQYSVPYIERD
jgi:phosphoglycerate-specific signal transduction histidine kinase